MSVLAVAWAAYTSAASVAVGDAGAGAARAIDAREARVTDVEKRILLSSSDSSEITGTEQAGIYSEREVLDSYKHPWGPRGSDIWLRTKMGHLGNYRLSLQAMMQNVTNMNHGTHSSLDATVWRA